MSIWWWVLNTPSQFGTSSYPPMHYLGLFSFLLFFHCIIIVFSSELLNIHYTVTSFLIFQTRDFSYQLRSVMGTHLMRSMAFTIGTGSQPWGSIAALQGNVEINPVRIKVRAGGPIRFPNLGFIPRSNLHKNISRKLLQLALQVP